jgi:hypothetical protein
MAYRGFHELLTQLNTLSSPNLRTGEPLNILFKIGADEVIVRSSVLLHPEVAITRNKKNLEMLKLMLPFTGERIIYREIEPGDHRTVPLLFPPYTTEVDIIKPELALDKTQYKKPPMPELQSSIMSGDQLLKIIKQALSPPKIVPIFAILFKNGQPFPTKKAIAPTNSGLTDDVNDILYSGEFTFEIRNGIADLKSISQPDDRAIYIVKRGNANWSSIKADTKKAIIRSILNVFKEVWERIYKPKDEKDLNELLKNYPETILNIVTRAIAEQLDSHFYSFGSVSTAPYIYSGSGFTKDNLLRFLPGGGGQNFQDNLPSKADDLNPFLQYNRYIYGLIVLSNVLNDEETTDEVSNRAIATGILEEQGFAEDERLKNYLLSIVDNYLSGIIARMKNDMAQPNAPAKRTRNLSTNETKEPIDRVRPSLDRHALVGFEIDPDNFRFPDISLPCKYVSGLNETETPESYRTAYILSRQPVTRNIGLVVDRDNIRTFYHKLLESDKSTTEIEFGTLTSSTIQNLRYSQAIFLGGVFQNRFDYENSTVYPTLTLSDGTVITPEELAAIMKSNVFIGDCIEDKDTRQPVVIILSGFKSIFFARRLMELSPEGLFIAATVDTVNSTNENDIQQMLSYIGDAARIDEIEGIILAALNQTDINNAIKEEISKRIVEKILKELNMNEDRPYRSIMIQSINKYLDGAIRRNNIFDDLFNALQNNQYADLINNFTLDKFITIMLQYGSADIMDNYISGQPDDRIIDAAIELGIGFNNLFGKNTAQPNIITQQGPGTSAILNDGFPEGENIENGILSIVSLHELKVSYYLLKPDSELDFRNINNSNIRNSLFLKEWKEIFRTIPLRTICETLFTGKAAKLSSFLKENYGVHRLAASLINKQYNISSSAAIAYPAQFLNDAGLEEEFVDAAREYIKEATRLESILTWNFEDGNPDRIATGFDGLYSLMIQYIPSDDIKKIQNNTFTYTRQWFTDTIMERGIDTKIRTEIKKMKFKEKAFIWATADSPITKTHMYKEGRNKYQKSYGMMELLGILEDENIELFGKGATAEGIQLHSSSKFHASRSPDNDTTEDYRCNIGYVWITSEQTTALAEKNTTDFEKLVRAMFSFMDYLCFYCARQELNETWRT